MSKPTLLHPVELFLLRAVEFIAFMCLLAGVTWALGWVVGNVGS